MPATRFSARLITLVSRFRHDKRANIAVIFTIALLPVLTAVGCASDYALAIRIKAKLQAAADAASVAAVSQSSPGYAAAEVMTSDGAVVAGAADASNVFNGNMSGTTGYTGLTLTSTVMKTGSTLTSNLQFSANVPAVFMGVIGYPNLTVTGSCAFDRFAAAVSGFLSDAGCFGVDGVAVDQPEQTRLAAVNPDNTAFIRTAACSPVISRRSPAPIVGKSTIRIPIAWVMRCRASATAASRVCSRTTPTTCRVRCCPA